MAKTALDGVRVWRDLLRRYHVADTQLDFTAVDFMVLSLLLDLEGIATVVCAGQPLRDLLEEAWAAGAPAVPRRARDTSPDDRHLFLGRLPDLGRGSGGAAVQLVYGVGRNVELAEVPAEGRRSGLRLLASAGPALWQCGLALVVPTGETTTAGDLLGRLNQCMRGEWIDPLALYERVQQLTATLQGLGHAAALDPDAKPDRIAELEQELASLKRTALVSQHLLLLQAADRMRTVP